MIPPEDLASKATEAVRRYTAGRGWAIARIHVSAIVHSSHGHFVWLRVTRTNNGYDLEFRYAIDVHGVGTLTLF